MARDCSSIVREALGDEGFDEADVESVIVRVNEIRQRVKAQGSVDNFDAKARDLIEQEAEKAKIAAALQRKQQALNILKKEQLRGQLDALVERGGLKPHEAFLALMEGAQKGVEFARASVYATRLAFETRYVGRMFGEVEKAVPHFRSLIDDPETNADIVREMYELRAGGEPGKTGNADAAAIAKVYAKYAEVSRVEANRMGAGIGKLDGWAGPQRHAAERIVKVPEDQWVNDIYGELDLGRTFPDAVDEKKIRSVLKDIYRTIITGRDSSETKIVEGSRPANLANSLAKTRVLHFKDADAWLRYNEKYGGGNITASMIGHQHRMSSANAQMQVFGTNPENMLKQLLEEWQVKVRDDPKLPPEQKQILAEKLTMGSGGLNNTAVGNALLEMQGTTLTTMNLRSARINQGVRNIQAMAKLGGAVITAAPTDFFMTGFASMFRGGGFWRGFTRQLAGMLEGRSSAEQRELMFLLNEGADGMIQSMTNIQIANDGVPGGLSRMSNTFFRWTGLTWWTDTVRFAAAKTASAEMGMRAKQGWSELPDVYRTLLQQRGITEAKWDVIRSAPFKSVNGTEYVTSDAVDGIADEAFDGLIASKLDDVRAKTDDPDRIAAARKRLLRDARLELELDIGKFLADEVNYAVIETDAASRRITTQGTQAGSFTGEAMRYVTQFKGFPIAFTQRVLGRSIYFDSKNGRRGRDIGVLLAGLTAAGYLSMTAKDFLKGNYPPRDPSDPKVLMAAMLQGGAAGIYGDFLFGEANRFGNAPLETLAGPALGTAAGIVGLYQDTLRGEGRASRALSLAIQNTPFANLWYTKPALDFLVLDSAREWASPGWRARRAQRLRKEYGQQRLW